MEHHLVAESQTAAHRQEPGWQGVGWGGSQAPKAGSGEGGNQPLHVSEHPSVPQAQGLSCSRKGDWSHVVFHSDSGLLLLSLGPRIPKIFLLELAEVFLGEHCALGFLLLQLGGWSVLGFPALVLEKDLRGDLRVHGH